MVLDYPDWSRVASGSLRFLGLTTITGPGSQPASYAVQPSERSIVFLFAGAAGMRASAQAVGRNSGMAGGQCSWGTYTGVLGQVPMAVSVNAVVDSIWDVTYSSAGSAGVASFWAFASTDQPPMLNAAFPQPVMLTDGQGLLIGQQASLQSMPVVPPSDLAIGTQGQKAMAASLPVVLASDQSFAGVATSSLWSQPAVGIQASVTFPATVGKRWRLLHATFTLYNTAATSALASAEVLDSATILFADPVVIPAVANSHDRCQLTGTWHVSTVGAALNLKFSGASAGCFQSVSAVATLE